MHATKTTTTQEDNAPLTYEQMYEHCWKYCRGIVTWKVAGIDYDTADDLVSDSYERLYRLWSAVDNQPAKMQKSYLARIVSNRVNDYLRRLKLERALFITEAQIVASLKIQGSHYEGDTDMLSVLAHLADGAISTDSSERQYIAREELAEILATCIGIREDDSLSAQRIRQGLLAEALGYSQAAIARVQGRSESAVKMELLRAKERIGARAASYATAPKPHISTRTTVTIRKGEAA